MSEETREPIYVQDERIETERLILRRFQPDDLDRYAEYHAMSEVARYILRPPLSRADAEKELTQWIAADRLVAEPDMVFFGVQLKDNSKLIGEVPIKLYSVPNLTAEIGWIFHPEVSGHGYASEAARALLSLAFDRLGMRRVVSYLDSRNEASANVCRRIGMQLEAHFRENLFNQGEWLSTFVFGILEREWRASQPAS